MNTVYVVFRNFYPEWDIAGLFEDRRDAMDWIKNRTVRVVQDVDVIYKKPYWKVYYGDELIEAFLTERAARQRERVEHTYHQQYGYTIEEFAVTPARQGAK